MDSEQLKAEIDYLFKSNLEHYDEDGFNIREKPHPELLIKYNIDASYLITTLDWEGSSIHPSSRICTDNEEKIHQLMQSSSLPQWLFSLGLQMYAESLIAYNEKKNRKGLLRYYPPIIFTFWSGFESFIRYSSELMLLTAYNIPSEVEIYLREKERYQPVLDRYMCLLKYGFTYTLEKGSRHFQALKGAQERRDYYTHVKFDKELRSISSTQVLDYMEAILLAIIFPSSQIKKTILRGIYNFHSILVGLRQLTKEFIEQPTDFMGVPIINDSYIFYCPFSNVDTERFPNLREQREKDKNNS
ncbi:MAG TPA: hypothetical protein V6D25_01405 [Leptolyngbyaceae cyanobacterium]